MGTFSPRARLWSCSLSDQAWVPDTVAKWRTRSFSRVNCFGVGSYGVGRVRQPGKIGGELANSAWHQKPAWMLRRESPPPDSRCPSSPQVTLLGKSGQRQVGSVSDPRRNSEGGR